MHYYCGFVSLVLFCEQALGIGGLELLNCSDNLCVLLLDLFRRSLIM
jgi:hypothetical protein